MAISAQAIGSTSPTKKSASEPTKPLPVPNSDFYQLADVLTREEKAIVKKVRTYMETKVQPVINKYWSDEAFPIELLPSFRELQLCSLPALLVTAQRSPETESTLPNQRLDRKPSREAARTAPNPPTTPYVPKRLPTSQCASLTKGDL
jgi:hypothetical protein